MTKISVKRNIQLHKEQRGAAMIIAIVISMVFVILSATIMLAGYSLYRSVLNDNNDLRCRELAQSIADTFEEDILTSFNSYTEQESARIAGKNAFWFYVRDNIWQKQENVNTDWFYYSDNINEQTLGHTLSNSKRYFQLDGDSSMLSQAADSITVTVYWKCSGADYLIGILDADETYLYVQVDVKQMSSDYCATRAYHLARVCNYEDVDNGSVTIEPEKKRADYYKWVWKRYEY